VGDEEKKEECRDETSEQWDGRVNQTRREELDVSYTMHFILVQAIVQMGCQATVAPCSHEGAGGYCRSCGLAAVRTRDAGPLLDMDPRSPSRQFKCWTILHGSGPETASSGESCGAMRYGLGKWRLLKGCPAKETPTVGALQHVHGKCMN